MQINAKIVMCVKMDENEQSNLFQTFQAVINSAISEKKQDEKMGPKLENANIKANITLQVGKDEFVHAHLLLKDGTHEFKLGNLDNYDIELIASPEDMMGFSTGELNTFQMITQKNEFGDTKLRVKKGGRNLGKLLFVSNLLVF